MNVKKSKRNYKRAPKSVKNSLSVPQKKEVKYIVNKTIKSDTEYKQMAYGASTGSIYCGTAGLYTLDITGQIIQGIGDSQRVGDEINIKSLHMRFNLWNNIDLAYTTWRIIVFQYKTHSLSFPPTLAQMVLQSASNTGGTYGAMSSRNIDFMNSYHVLYDKMIMTDKTTFTSKLLRVSIPLKYAKKKIQYSAAGVSTLDGLFLFITTHAGTTTNNPAAQVDLNLSYTDN